MEVQAGQHAAGHEPHLREEDVQAYQAAGHEPHLRGGAADESQEQGGELGSGMVHMARRISSYTLEQVEQELDVLLAGHRQPTLEDQSLLYHLLARDKVLQPQGYQRA